MQLQTPQIFSQWIVFICKSLLGLVVTNLLSNLYRVSRRYSQHYTSSACWFLEPSQILVQKISLLLLSGHGSASRRIWIRLPELITSEETSVHFKGSRNQFRKNGEPTRFVVKRWSADVSTLRGVTCNKKIGCPNWWLLMVPIGLHYNCNINMLRGNVMSRDSHTLLSPLTWCWYLIVIETCQVESSHGDKT